MAGILKKTKTKQKKLCCTSVSQFEENASREKHSDLVRDL